VDNTHPNTQGKLTTFQHQNDTNDDFEVYFYAVLNLGWLQHQRWQQAVLRKYPQLLKPKKS
jgi:hypothetical protein